MKSVSYYLLSFISFLVSFIGFIGLKLAIVTVAVGIAFLTEQYLGVLGLAIGWIIGLFVGGLLFIGLERLYPYLERLDKHTKTLKKYPYTEKYGKNYPRPKPEDFGITQAEFIEYNNRFQFENIKLIFTYGLCIVAFIYVIVENSNRISKILLIGVTGIVAITLNYVFDHFNTQISQKHPYYKKITKFQNSMDIYHKISNENSKI